MSRDLADLERELAEEDESLSRVYGSNEAQIARERRHLRELRREEQQREAPFVTPRQSNSTTSRRTGALMTYAELEASRAAGRARHAAEMEAERKRQEEVVRLQQQRSQQQKKRAAELWDFAERRSKRLLKTTTTMSRLIY